MSIKTQENCSRKERITALKKMPVYSFTPFTVKKFTDSYIKVSFWKNCKDFNQLVEQFKNLGFCEDYIHVKPFELLHIMIYNISSTDDCNRMCEEVIKFGPSAHGYGSMEVLVNNIMYLYCSRAQDFVTRALPNTFVHALYSYNRISA